MEGIEIVKFLQIWRYKIPRNCRSLYYQPPQQKMLNDVLVDGH